MRLSFFFLLIASTLCSCTIEPVDITYGLDQCHACRMTISDQRFGAELVSIKGKIFKFDAIECMIPEMIAQGHESYAYIMATDYSQPATLLEVADLDFLESPEIPSPMGRNLSAHKMKTQTSSDGAKWYKWNELVESFRK